MPVESMLFQDIPDAWWNTMRMVYNYGSDYLIDSGSRSGQYRRVMPVAFHCIECPETRPLSPLARPGVPSVCTDDSIEEYFHQYVLSPHPPAPNEHYNYSEWLYRNVETAILLYRTQGLGTAHCTLRVGDPFSIEGYLVPADNDLEKHTTPCLLGIDTRVLDSKLAFYVMYRSWDLLSGYPVNMGGFQLLKEYMAAQLDIEPGVTFVFCKDLHLYHEDFPAVEAWLGV